MINAFRGRGIWDWDLGDDGEELAGELVSDGGVADIGMGSPVVEAGII
jgi:hypothetical protein